MGGAPSGGGQVAGKSVSPQSVPNRARYSLPATLSVGK